MGSGNSIWQSNPGTWNEAGNPNTDIWASGVHNKTSFPFGTNTYSNAGFANPNGLPTTAPNCSGYADTMDCMNGRYQFAADLTPSGGAAGLGYQAPGACTTDLYFPTWLNGAVNLHWTSDRVEPNRKLRFDNQALRHVYSLALLAIEFAKRSFRTNIHVQALATLRFGGLDVSIACYSGVTRGSENPSGR